jgi:hypothetical protein
MESKSREFGRFLWRTTAAHMAAYYLAGILALVFMGYRELFGTGALALLMLPVESPIVALGPALQCLMGAALALILFPFRSLILEGRAGWERLLLLIGGLSVFAPQIPGPGTFEGLLYTRFSIMEHLLSLPESIAYSLFFSGIMALWNRFPKKAWNAIAIVAVSLIGITSLLGLLSSLGLLPS